MSAVYTRVIMLLEKRVPAKMMPFWQHPAGPKTIHFWAPFFKSGLVIAGLSDLKRPVEKLSFSQSLSLGLTGCIWSRYCTVIIPVNWYLFSVNLFLGGVGATQCCRVLLYRQELEKEGKVLPPLF
ncbi:mitochondrial pyruvate carrier 2 isoform X1 [Hydra vulgaris]|uniref:Mitochondrial pyruvate carrier n=1 Tax=Hydra vulgaris TaxID=6087 RepID=T2MHP3_HYDVU|nr:mitochondrial pyruvate carrier 2 [Hydra vulgaris]